MDGARAVNQSHTATPSPCEFKRLDSGLIHEDNAPTVHSKTETPGLCRHGQQKNTNTASVPVVPSLVVFRQKGNEETTAFSFEVVTRIHSIKLSFCLKVNVDLFLVEFLSTTPTYLRQSN